MRYLYNIKSFERHNIFESHANCRNLEKWYVGYNLLHYLFLNLYAELKPRRREECMKNLRLKILIFTVLFFVVAMNTQAAVTDLVFYYGKSTSPSSPPTSWVQRLRPDGISYEYAQYQESFNFNAGEYVFFGIGLVNIDSPGSLFIDKVELNGPAGAVPIYNSGFESGNSGWTTLGDRDVEGDFSISLDAYEGSNAAKLTVTNSGSYSLRGQVAADITQSGVYTLSIYTKVYEEVREIPPDEIFAMEVGNQWVYDSNIRRKVTSIDSTTFERDTFEIAIFENGLQIGEEFYEVWKGYLRFWGIYDAGLYKFGFGLLGGWFPASVGDQKVSMAWVINYGTTVDLTVDLIGIEPVTLNFATLDAYRLRYKYVFSGPGGTTGLTYDNWFVPYIGVVKQQYTDGIANLVSFAVFGGSITKTSDNDEDGLLDFMELTTYNTDPNDSDSDNDGFSDGDEVNIHGTDPNDPYSHPARAMPWIPLLLLGE